MAGALNVGQLIFLTDQEGILDKQKQLIQNITPEQIQALMEDATVQGGMLTKAKAILHARKNGIPCVRVLNGKRACDAVNNEALGTLSKAPVKSEQSREWRSSMLQLKSMHFLTGEELSQDELMDLIVSADKLRLERDLGPTDVLRGKTVALLFDKPSLRTRVSFTVGVHELGGQVFELLGSQKKSEEPEDTIRVLQGMIHGVMMRTFDHQVLERMASQANIPVINGLSDSHHPCQALADLLTIYQRFGKFKGVKLAYIGDGNNVLHSLLLLAPFLGVELHYACPEGFQPDPDVVTRAKQRALRGGGKIRKFKTPDLAAADAHVLYTDVWTSMGQEQKAECRQEAFFGYQINRALFALAKPSAIVMHCLPMVTGQEITREMVEHPASRIFQQSENRLHAQKGVADWFVQRRRRQNQNAKPELEYSHVI